MKLGVWLLAMVEPMIAKILLALGLSVTSIAGMDFILTTLKNQFVADMNSMPADWLNFALYLWIGKALGVIFAACSTKLMLWTIQSGTSLLGKSA